MTSKVPPAPPCTLVIFGARGDLTKRLLIPALYNLAVAHRLDPAFKVIGVDHGESDDLTWRAGLRDFLQQLGANRNSEFGKAKINAKAWEWLEGRLFYQRGDFEDDADYVRLGERLATVGGKGGNALFYLATAPEILRRRRGAAGAGRLDGRTEAGLSPRGDREAVRK